MSNGIEGVLHISQSSRTGASPSDCLALYLEHLLWWSNPSAAIHLAYSTAPINWAVHNLESGTRAIVFHEKADKTNFVYFNQDIAIFTHRQASEISRPIHIPRQQYFIYWKYWQAFDHMEICSLWFNKTGFLLSCKSDSTSERLYHLDSKEILGDRTMRKLHKNDTNHGNNVIQKSRCTATYLPSLKPST